MRREDPLPNYSTLIIFKAYLLFSLITNHSTESPGFNPNNSAYAKGIVVLIEGESDVFKCIFVLAKALYIGKPLVNMKAYGGGWFCVCAGSSADASGDSFAE